MKIEDLQTIILAGGKGKRMGDETIPKVLQIINGRPLVSYVLEDLNGTYNKHIPILVVGHMAEDVMSALGEKYRYVKQEEQLGTGHAVMAARDYISTPYLLVLNGDMPLMGNNAFFLNLVQLTMTEKTKVVMATNTVPDFSGCLKSLHDYGRVVRDKTDGKVLKIVEKKDASSGELEIQEVNPGVYVFETKWLYDNIHKLQNKNAQGEYYLTDMVGLAISQGYNVETIDMPPEQALGVNTKEQLQILENVMMNK